MAHNIVAYVVRETLDAGMSAMDITSEQVDRAALELFDRKLDIPAAVIAQALDPLGNVKLRTVEGGPAPENLKSMLEGRLGSLAEDRRWLETAISRTNHARSKVFEEARTLRQAST